MTTHSLCHRHLQDTILNFRIGIEPQGSEALMKFIDCLSSRLEVNAALMGEKESIVLAEILSAQERGDFLFMCDLLEYELKNTNLWQLVNM